ncbi:hypothetical protein LEP1GSC197_1770 [Leptospira interrogans serovar Pomona str. CSL4002]|nr:hypothetical protein LEP1GSC197_1770 [Leptospira interrogans serovar Pomona str. CSL4002]
MGTLTNLVVTSSILKSVGTPTNLDYTIKFSVFKISCTKDFGSLYLRTCPKT